MRTDRYSKAVLTLIALSLAILAGENLRGPTATVDYSAALSRKWEYKWIFRTFALKNGKVTGLTSYFESGTPAGGPLKGLEMSTKLLDLGAQGWELVSVTPYAMSYGQSDLADASIVHHLSGVTDGDSWVFKRPKL